MHFFKLYPSRMMFALLLIVYSLAISVCLLISKELWLSILLALLLTSALAFYLCRDAVLLLPTSCIKLSSDGANIILIMRNGSEISGQLARDSLITATLTILNIVSKNKVSVRSVVIFPDSMGKEEFRELRVQLKWNSNVK